jgi:hypothetical protein
MCINPSHFMTRVICVNIQYQWEILGLRFEAPILSNGARQKVVVASIWQNCAKIRVILTKKKAIERLVSLQMTD